MSNNDKNVLWADVKKRYLSNSQDTENKTNMITLYETRTAVLTKILGKLKEEFQDVRHALVGSENYTSDKDYIITHASYEVRAKFIERFHGLFAEQGYTFSSSEAFDVNLYGCAPVDTVNPFRKGSPYVLELKSGQDTLYDCRVYTKTPGVLDENYISTERVAALVKLWQYNPELCEKLQQNTKTPALLKNHISNAKSTWGTIQLNINKEAKQIMNAGPVTARIKAMNKILVSKLKLVQTQIEKMNEKNEYNKDDHLKYNKDLIEVAYYQQEGYYSTGAYVHTVIQTQKNIAIHVHESEYVNSFIENAGDTFKTLQHEQTSQLQNEKICQSALIQASKYIQRKLAAVATRLDTTEDSNITNLLSSLSFLVKQRGGGLNPGEANDQTKKTSEQLHDLATISSSKTHNHGTCNLKEVLEDITDSFVSLLLGCYTLKYPGKY